MGNQSLFEELKRRRVFRATGVYVVVASGVVAVASDAFPALLLPDWTVTLVVALAILGLPVTVALSWAFDIRPPDHGESAINATRDPAATAGKGLRGRGEASAAPSAPAPATASRLNASRIAVVGAVVILGLAGVAMLLIGDGPEVMENRVAVLPFQNRTGDPALDGLGAVAADWITDGLVSISAVEVVPTSTVDEALPDAGMGTADPIPAVAAATGAGLLVTGSYVLRGDTLEVRAQLIEWPENRVLGPGEPARALRSRPTAALGPVRERLMGQVASRVDTYREALDFLQDPPSYEAYRHFLAGKDLFVGQGRIRESIDRFDRAIAVDSGFLLPRVWIAAAFDQMGDYRALDSVLKLSQPFRAQATGLEQLALAAGDARLRGDLAAAYRAAGELYRRSPTVMSRFIAALYAQRYNHLSEAAELYRGLLGGEDRLPGTYSYGNLAGALHDLGEHEEELAVARAGAERFPASSSMIYREARALAGLGRVDEAVTRLRELSTLSPLETSRWLQVRGGLELRRHGRPDVGEREVRRGLDWFLAHDSLAYPYTIARIRLWLGEQDAAVRDLRALVEEQPEDLDYLGLLGVALAAAGHTEEARDVEARIADWSEPYLHGSDLYWRAAISARLGDKERAVTLLEDAVARGYTFSYLHEDEDLRPLWNYPPFKELIEPKE